MKAYKVVSKNSDYTSFMNGPYCLWYKIGDKTYPRIGKILCFKLKEDALAFIEHFGTYNTKLLYGEAENLKGITILSKSVGDDATFWKLYKSKKNIKKNVKTCAAPKGTCVCDSFTPIELVVEI